MSTAIVRAVLKRIDEEMDQAETAEVVRYALDTLAERNQIRLLADFFKENDHLIEEIVDINNEEA